MATKNKRTMVSVPPEWESEITALKKEQFFNDTHAEMYRQLIRLGLDAINKENSQKSLSETA
jgi:hypothetical protein